MAYIKQEVVMDKFEKLKERAETLRDTIYLDGVLAVIENIPAADVVEVKHGYWKDNTNGTFTCSVCNRESSKMDYCGRCGAKMDKESAQ